MTKGLYRAAGIAAVGLGLVGVALPILPTVPFLLLAAFCFARSHPEWEQRLLDPPDLRRTLARLARAPGDLAPGQALGARRDEPRRGLHLVRRSAGRGCWYPWQCWRSAGSWIWTRNE